MNPRSDAALPLLFVFVIILSAVASQCALHARACADPGGTMRASAARPGRVFATAADVRRQEARELLSRGAPGQDLDPAVVLARVCVKEAGFDSPQDCSAIRVVLQRVGRGDVVRGARLYTPATFLPHRLGERPWIAFLRGDGERPSMWPGSMDWARYAPRWLALVEHARLVLASPLWCGADHWGDRAQDYRRALAYGWVPADCGTTRNLFWTRRE